MSDTVLLIFDDGVQVNILNTSENIGLHKGIILLKLGN